MILPPGLWNVVSPKRARLDVAGLGDRHERKPQRGDDVPVHELSTAASVDSRLQGSLLTVTNEIAPLGPSGAPFVGPEKEET